MRARPTDHHLEWTVPHVELLARDSPTDRILAAVAQAQPVADSEKKRAVLKTFAMKYYPEESMVDAEIADAGKAAQMYVIDIEHISGKEVQEK